MPQGLSVSRVVGVDISFAPQAVPLLNFDTLLILGDTDVVNTGEGIREYNGIDEVAAEFDDTAPEFLAAELFFSQSPQPNTLFIGRWARTATHGLNVGGILTGTEQLLSAWTGITNGEFRVTIDGAGFNDVTGLNFSGATSLDGVAAIIDAALGGATVAWDAVNDRFVITSGSTGTGSSVGYGSAVPGGTGTAIHTQLKISSTTATRLVQGIAAESPVAAVTRVDGLGWYAAMFAASTMPNDAQNLAVMAYIEASGLHVFGVSSQDGTAILNAGSTADLASQASLADYRRSFVQYSSTTRYVVASWFGRAFTTNFEGSNTTLTMKFKKEPGVTPEILTATQASTLQAKRCNAYDQYNNGASIIQEGVMSGLAFFDEIHGTDWLANRLQTDLFNVLYQAPKIPQTNPGVGTLLAACDGALSQAVTNGLCAPGVWNAPGFGAIVQGQYLSKGWYSYAASVDTQPQSEREARVAPLIQIAMKLAGAIHFVDCLVNVNR